MNKLFEYTIDETNTLEIFEIEVPENGEIFDLRLKGGQPTLVVSAEEEYEKTTNWELMLIAPGESYDTEEWEDSGFHYTVGEDKDVVRYLLTKA